MDSAAGSGRSIYMTSEQDRLPDDCDQRETNLNEQHDMAAGNLRGHPLESTERFEERSQTFVRYRPPVDGTKPQDQYLGTLQTKGCRFEKEPEADNHCLNSKEGYFGHKAPNRDRFPLMKEKADRNRDPLKLIHDNYQDQGEKINHNPDAFTKYSVPMNRFLEQSDHVGRNPSNDRCQVNSPVPGHSSYFSRGDQKYAKTSELPDEHQPTNVLRRRDVPEQSRRVSIPEVPTASRSQYRKMSELSDPTTREEERVEVLEDDVEEIVDVEVDIENSRTENLVINVLAKIQVRLEKK